MAPEVPEPYLSADAVINRPAWMENGACAESDRNLFFPARGASVLPALAVCKNCAVRPECFSFALADSSLTGIWGGTSEVQRRKLRQRAS